MQSDGYTAILSLFAEDKDKQFNLLRLKLVRFFEIQGASTEAEDLADETISRVAEKLSEGVKIEVAEPFFYFRGVAVNILREHWRSRQKTVSFEDTANKDFISNETNPDEIEKRRESLNLKERKLDCLQKTLQVLPSENRELFLQYHRENNISREVLRAGIAEKMKIDVTALRNRVTRLRKKIEQLVLECLEK
jgi:RNA polymerase sigma factor (sigma-70 family)